MYSCLKPELRGAQRILRLIRVSPPTCTALAPRTVVRSFSSFVRLQDQGNPHGSNGPAKPVDQRTETLKDRLLRQINSFSEAAEDQPQPQSTPSAEASESTQHTPSQDGSFPTDSLEYNQTYNEIQSNRGTSEIPEGYHLAERLQDVPQQLRKFDDKEDLYHFPYIYTLDSNKPDAFTLIPKHNLPGGLAPNSHASTGKDEMQSTASDAAKDQKDSGKRHGSYLNRRKRVRDKEAAAPSASLPEWFYANNLFRAIDRQARSFPASGTLSAPDYLPVTNSTELDQAQAQISPQEAVKQQDPAPKQQSYAKGGIIPPFGDSDSSPAPIVPTSTISNAKSLANDRYFLEEAQYYELLNTFKGRLREPIKKEAKRDAVATDHLTILHGAQDTEILFDHLVLDLCGTVGADRIRIDAQDIAALAASSDVGDGPSKRSAAQLSFKLYQNLYGPSEYQESMFPRQEDEENNDDEDDEDSDSDSMNPPGSIDIPVGSFAVPIGGAMNLSGKGALAGLFNNLDRINRGPRMSPGFGMFSSDPGPPQEDTFGSMIQALLSSVSRPQKPEGETDDSAVRPMVIHLENYRALQEHPWSAMFMSELIPAVDKKRAEGHTIMIIGTDSLRNDFHKSSPPRSILEVQDRKSSGASTAIILTPVFPDRNAELALQTEDRQARIRNINARHLHQILKTRGVLLHGLEDGFWKHDFKNEIGELDYEALSGQFWPFNQVQRVSALVAGIQSTAPIHDACEIIQQSDESKVAWAQRNQPDIYRQEYKDVQADAERVSSENRQLNRVRKSATRHEKKLLSGVIEPKKIATTFEDIHIPADTVSALKMLTTLSLQRPEAFRYGVLKSDRIPGLLLYGPPGTGKTLAAKAVAKESGATMLEVSAADLNDMYVGEGEKNVQALFSLARKLSPCVVFLDEADAMFSARQSNRGRASHRELLNQFLKEWDGMSNDSGSAFIMVATNRPHDLDDAVLRRLPRRLLVDLPTEQDRQQILQIHLRHENLAADVNLADLAKRTPFYSGSDLKNVAVAAALNAVKEENEIAAKHNSEQEGKEEQQEYQYPERRTLVQKHFDKALEEISASISEDMSTLKDIKKFDEQYGDRKGRKTKAPRWGFKSAAEADKVLDTVKVREMK